MYNIVVVGAGIVGLSTAVNIQKKLPNAKVRIIAEKFDRDTTSWGACGLFRPSTKFIEGIDINRLRRWLTDTWELYCSLATSEAAGDTGMQIVTGFILGHNKPEGPLYEEFVFSHRNMSRNEMVRLNFGTYEYGQEVRTIVTTVKKYYPWLMKRFKDNGGETEQRRVASLDEFVGKYDVVVNCTGLESRNLVGDNTIYPVRGQLVRARAPWIKYFIFTEDDTYFLPNEDLLCLGGCRQKGNYSLTNTMEDTEGIMERCTQLCPALKGANIEQVWTGLRPTRNPPRVEKETIHLNTGQLKVVHNYGHGSNGIALSWGTSVEAASHVVSSLNPSSRL